LRLKMVNWQVQKEANQKKSDKSGIFLFVILV